MSNVTQVLPTVNPDPETVGWRMFFAGRLLSECRNPEERAGWLAACERGATLVGVL